MIKQKNNIPSPIPVNDKNSKKSQFMSKKRINSFAASFAFLIFMIHIEPLFTAIIGFIFIQLCIPISVIFIAEAIKEKSWKKETAKRWWKYLLNIFDLTFTTFFISLAIYASTSLLLWLSIKYYFDYEPKIIDFISEILVCLNISFISFFSFRFVLQKSVSMYREEILFNFKDLYDSTY